MMANWKYVRYKQGMKLNKTDVYVICLRELIEDNKIDASLGENKILELCGFKKKGKLKGYDLGGYSFVMCGDLLNAEDCTQEELDVLRKYVNRKTYSMSKIAWDNVIGGMKLNVSIHSSRKYLDKNYEAGFRRLTIEGEVNHQLVSKIYDVHSMYPWMLHSKSKRVYVSGQEIWIPYGNEIPEKYRLNYLVECSWDKITPNKGIVDIIGDETRALWKNEYDYMVKNYKVEGLKIKGYWVYDSVMCENGGIGVDENIDKFYELKKMDNGCGLWKKMLNYLTGRFGMKINKGTEIERRSDWVLIGAQLIAYVRCYMANIINGNYDKFVYYATDAIHSAGKIDNIEIGDEMGQFSVEDVEKSYYMGKANYIYKTKDGVWHDKSKRHDKVQEDMENIYNMLVNEKSITVEDTTKLGMQSIYTYNPRKKKDDKYWFDEDL